MASTMIGVNNPGMAAAWSKKIFAEALRESFFAKFLGDDEGAERLTENDPGNLISVRSELQKEPGGSIKLQLRAQLQGDGVVDNETLEGNEEALNYRHDTVNLGELATAVRFNNRITQQRMVQKLRKEAKAGLRDWWAETMDQTMISHLAGDTLQSSRRFRGNNSIVAPSYLLRANSASNSTETAVGGDNTATINLQRLSTMKAYAIEKRMRPVKTPMGPRFLAFIHDEHYLKLRNDVTANTNGTFLDIQKAAMSGGKIKDNPLITGAEFEWDGMLVYKTDRLPRGINAAGTDYVANTRRAVVAGAQGLCLAYGMENDAEQATYTEVEHDYKREIGCSMSSIFGMKKTRFSALTVDEAVDSSTALDFSAVVGCFYTTAISSSI